MLPVLLCPDESVHWTVSRTLVPFALYSPAGDVKGVAEGIGVSDGAVEGLLVEVGVTDGLGDGVAEGTANKPVPNTRNAPRTTAAATTTPATIIIFLFFALVCGLFLPHSGLA